MTEPRYCTNCRAELSDREQQCAQCGVFAGDVFDGRMPRPKKKKPSGLLFGLLVIAILAGAGRWLYLEREKSKPGPPSLTAPSAHVVSDRPGGAKRAAGATINQAEAVRLLRRHLVNEREIRNECLALIAGANAGNAYVFSVVNSCENVRLGRWRVDGKTGAVAPAK